MHLHGGGFVIGSLDTHDAMCRSLAEGAGVVVVSVDYRLAPEHPAPAAVRDVDDALADVMRRAGELDIDVERLAVGGDSAGANLAAVAAIHHERSRSQRPELAPLRFQLLMYPTFVLTAELDPLRDEGEAGAERLRGAGVEVQLSRYDGASHGFVQMAAFAGIGRRALDECVGELRGALEPARG